MNKWIAWLVLGGLLLTCTPPACASQPVKAIAVGGGYAFALAADGTVWTWGQVPVQVSGLSGVTAIAANYHQLLAVKTDGTVWAWGLNGPPGYSPNGPIPFTPAPPAPVKGLSGIVAVSAGGAHALALKNDGTVWAWGENAWGTLGNGTTLSRTVPSQVSGLSGVIGIAAGQAHSLAVRTDGSVWAWGDNQWGQLGNGTTTPAGTPNPLPVQVSGVAGAVTVAAGYGHSLALKSDGTLWGWGHNGSGQLGDGTRMNIRPAPQQVGLIGGVMSIDATDFGTRAVKDDGTLWMWGMLTYESGQLTPLMVVGLSGVRMAAGGLALKRDGTVWAWSGLWGDGVPTMRSAPARVPGLPVMTAVSARGNGGLALAADGRVWEWQGNTAPSMVGGLTGVTAIAAGSGHNLALIDGVVWKWTADAGPGPVSGLSDVQAIAAGENGSLALKRDGTVWMWAGTSNPRQVIGLSDVAAIAIAYEWYLWDEIGAAQTMLRGLALKKDGTVWAWGRVDWITADTQPVVVNEPAQVPDLTGVISIAGGEISIAVNADGTVWAWNESAMDTWAPVQIEDVTGATAAAVGARQWWNENPHYLMLKTDGMLWAEGSNSKGQLGDGTTTDRTSPVQVALLTDVVSVSAAGSHSLALKRDGTVWEWGDLGVADTRPAPVQVIQPGSPDLAITMQHSGKFTVGETVNYAVTVINTGDTATTGSVTVIDALPPGLTFRSDGGNGWSCLSSRQVVTCTFAGPVLPATAIVLNLNMLVEPQAWPGVTNLAVVNNESDRNVLNNMVGDPAAVKAR